jgi:hypothetical protein
MEPNEGKSIVVEIEHVGRSDDASARGAGNGGIPEMQHICAPATFSVAVARERFVEVACRSAAQAG